MHFAAQPKGSSDVAQILPNPQARRNRLPQSSEAQRPCSCGPERTRHRQNLRARYFWYLTKPDQRRLMKTDDRNSMVLRVSWLKVTALLGAGGYLLLGAALGNLRDATDALRLFGSLLFACAALIAGYNATGRALRLDSIGIRQSSRWSEDVFVNGMISPRSEPRAGRRC